MEPSCNNACLGALYPGRLSNIAMPVWRLRIHDSRDIKHNMNYSACLGALYPGPPRGRMMPVWGLCIQDGLALPRPRDKVSGCITDLLRRRTQVVQVLEERWTVGAIMPVWRLHIQDTISISRRLSGGFVSRTPMRRGNACLGAYVSRTPRGLGGFLSAQRLSGGFVSRTCSWRDNARLGASYPGPGPLGQRPSGGFISRTKGCGCNACLGASYPRRDLHIVMPVRRLHIQDPDQTDQCLSGGFVSRTWPSMI
jgi:hypothetical protein